jgi:chemotaxis protein methyltransferase CheR
MNPLDAWSAELSKSFGLRAQNDWAKEISAVLAGTGSAAHPDDARDRERVLEEIARRVTVGETHFFRHHEQLARASEALLERGAKEGRRVQVWCAGCASGEEPYSVAMLLHRRLLRRLPEGVEILATDLNPDVIERAKQATYTAWSFRGTPSWALNHFAPDAGRNLRLVTPEVRGAVRFEAGSCQAKTPGLRAQSLDLISFRNVAIYFEPRAVTALYAEFFRILRAGGQLALGPSDPRPADAQFQFLGYADHAPLYERRPTEGAPARPSPRLFEPSAFIQPRTSAPSHGERPLLEPYPTPAPRRSDPVRLSARPLAPTGLEAAQQHADRGETESALRVARALVEAEPTSGMAQRLLGQIELELGNRTAAVAALRQSVFLDPDAALARCFYAVALKECGEPAQALHQLEIVEGALSRRTAGDLLEDGETRASELALTVAFLRGEWR